MGNDKFFLISTEAEIFNNSEVEFDDIIGVIMHILIYMYTIIHTYVYTYTQECFAKVILKL